ncbi:hypothetical protein ABZ816_27335 [Actinosynnema sp. NPDC047251]|uniref:Uncharacterized protein n=1 Tax=Saccharothrix espanaensis (strain ATCC 51144 / DSM 44229 / JCM 9112 / NBRC 15066 / NRRL 15764) TaxID=1179773 RepID=K0JPH6_SACES|nr:hypothetical protein [Saccharothrix espanaensis]CCH28715.1 hypothetical protein BN6_13890 [Saccharothrix espanaensis DSM 44229]
MPVYDALYDIARQRNHDDQATATRYRLGRSRLKAFSGLLKLDWEVARERRSLVASVGFSWQRTAG